MKMVGLCNKQSFKITMSKHVQLLQDQATGEEKASESTPMPTLSKIGVILAFTGDQGHSFSLLVRRRVQGGLKRSLGDSNISFKHSSTDGSSTKVISPNTIRR